jgi:hypothetical protein
MWPGEVVWPGYLTSISMLVTTETTLYSYAYHYALQVWPGETVWPDYLSNANTSKWLTEQVAAFYKQVPFGGLWYGTVSAFNAQAQ